MNTNVLCPEARQQPRFHLPSLLGDAALPQASATTVHSPGNFHSLVNRRPCAHLSSPLLEHGHLETAPVHVKNLRLVARGDIRLEELIASGREFAQSKRAQRIAEGIAAPLALNANEVIYNKCTGVAESIVRSWFEGSAGARLVKDRWLTFRERAGRNFREFDIVAHSPLTQSNTGQLPDFIAEVAASTYAISNEKTKRFHSGASLYRTLNPTMRAAAIIQVAMGAMTSINSAPMDPFADRWIGGQSLLTLINQPTFLHLVIPFGWVRELADRFNQPFSAEQIAAVEDVVEKRVMLGRRSVVII